MARTSSPSTVVTVGAVSTLIWAADVNRLSTWIRNAGPGTVSFVLGGVATSDGWDLVPGEAMELDSSLALYGIADAAGTKLKLWQGLEEFIGGGSGGAGGDDGDQVVAALASKPEVRVSGDVATTPAAVRRLELAPWTYGAAVAEAAAKAQARVIANPNLRVWQIRHRFSAGATGTGTLHLHYQVADGSWYILGAMALTNAPTVANGYSQLIEIPAPDSAIAVAAVYSDYVDGTLTVRITGIE